MNEMNRTRDQIITAASELLEQQGYHATSLGQILDRCGAPKGSLYYHFPGGKEELVATAVRHSAGIMAELVQARMEVGDHPAGAIANLILSLAERIRSSNYRSGSLIATVALEAAGAGGQVDQACRDAYQLWENTYRDGLHGAGYPPDLADRLAKLAVSSLEGAILLSRVERSTEPLLELADELFRAIEAACAVPALTPAPRPQAPKLNGIPARAPLRQRPVANWRSW